MTSSLRFLFQMMNTIWNTVFGSVSFSLGGVDVSLGAIILGFICTYMVVSFFWKGARG